MNTPTRYALAALLPLVLTAACVGSSTPSSTEPGSSPSAAENGQAETGEAEGRAGNDEAVEEAELTEKRLEAFKSARERGVVGAGHPIRSHPSPGWYGERLLNAKTDDWEPAVAADPDAPYVYMLTTRFGQPSICHRHCPTPFLALTVSSNGGKTWGPQEPVCACWGTDALYDPTIEVVPNTGVVYSVFLRIDKASGWSTAFVKSTDHGKTWTKPVPVQGRVAWTDKPEITSSATGRDVYVSWNGPRGGDLYVGISHNFGRTWSQVKLSDSKRYFYAYDGTVLPDGTIVFSESSLAYTGSGQSVQGRIWHYAVISRDRGHTWHKVVIDKVAEGVSCVAAGCSDDFYLGQTSVANDSNGHLVFAYEGARSTGGLQRVYVRTSDDQGRTWSRRVALSVKGENATQPRVDFAGPGQARIWYMQTSGGGDANAWRVEFRSSHDAGRAWSPAVRLSDATSGPGYVTAKGFKEIYGDYGEIAVTNRGKVIAVWGEGFSYIGPGGTWFALQK
jgi:hypothetical protein